MLIAVQTSKRRPDAILEETLIIEPKPNAEEILEEALAIEPKPNAEAVFEGRLTISRSRLPTDC